MTRDRIKINDGDNSVDAVISLIQKDTQITRDGERVYNYAPIGANDEDIQIYYNTATPGETAAYDTWGSLRNFFQEWTNFKTLWKHFIDESLFIYYGNKEPNSENVRIWFEINTNND